MSTQKLYMVLSDDMEWNEIILFDNLEKAIEAASKNHYLRVEEFQMQQPETMTKEEKEKENDHDEEENEHETESENDGGFRPTNNYFICASSSGYWVKRDPKDYEETRERLRSGDGSDPETQYT